MGPTENFRPHIESVCLMTQLYRRRPQGVWQYYGDKERGGEGEGGGGGEREQIGGAASYHKSSTYTMCYKVCSLNRPGYLLYFSL